MLGFSPLSGSPLSALSGGTESFAFLASNLMQITENSVLFVAESSVTAPNAVMNTTITPLLYDAKASLITGNVTASTAFSEMTTIAPANVTPSSATAFLTIYIGDFADEDAQARAFMSPATAFTSLDAVAFDAKAEVIPASILATLTPDVLEGRGIAHILIDDVNAYLYNNLSDPTAVIFPYQDYAALYDRERTVFLSGQENNTTVYIDQKPANTTVYITK